MKKIIEVEIHLKRLILATKTPDCDMSSENVVWVRAPIANQLIERGEAQEPRLICFFNDETESQKWRYSKKEENENP